MTNPAQTQFSLSLKGVNYVADVYGSYATANSLASVVSIDANTIAVTADFGIDAENSTVYANSVAGGYTESASNVGNTIAAAVNDGMSVMYRPLIDFLPSNYLTAPGQTNVLNGPYGADEWRTDYWPSNIATFFASYQTMIVQQAAVAEANGATLFCIGTELDQLTGPAYLSYWTSIITAIRQQDPNLKLTYAAEWDDDVSPWQWGPAGAPAGTGNITTQVSFWNQLDYVGIDEYAPISDLADPTVAQLVAGWTQTPTDATTAAVTNNQSLISYYEGIAAATGKPLLFTELGYANSSDADSTPATPGYDVNGNPDNATADPTLQANLYQAFFQAWQQHGNGSLAGVYSWDWEPNSASVGPANGINFSVQGEPAQQQLETGYAACFRAGTRIRTPRGDVAVEALRPGEGVVPACGGSVPVAWLGHRRVDCRRHPRPHDVWPVHVRPGAFGRDQPAADLWLSPDHAVFVDGVLIPIRYLMNGATIVQEAVDDVTYWHVELPRHGILLAEGLSCESYLDTGNRGAFANGGAAVQMQADFALRVWEAEACAPLVVSGPTLERVREALLRRLAHCGYVLTEEPELRFHADDREPIEPQVFGEWLCLALPENTTALRIASRRAAPAEFNAAGTDCRRLGVALTHARLDDAPLALGDPRFLRGWNAAEENLRWTDGAAVLDVSGASVVELRFARVPIRYAVAVPPAVEPLRIAV